MEGNKPVSSYKGMDSQLYSLILDLIEQEKLLGQLMIKYLMGLKGKPKS